MHLELLSTPGAKHHWVLLIFRDGLGILLGKHVKLLARVTYLIAKVIKNYYCLPVKVSQGEVLLYLLEQRLNLPPTTIYGDNLSRGMSKSFVSNDMSFGFLPFLMST